MNRKENHMHFNTGPDSKNHDSMVIRWWHDDALAHKPYNISHNNYLDNDLNAEWSTR